MTAQHIADAGDLVAIMAAARKHVTFAAPADIEAAERRRADERKRGLMAHGVPEGAAARIAAGRIEDSHALGRVRRWMRDPSRRPVLVLAGPKDASKTTAASLAVEAWPWWGLEQLPRLVAFELILGPWYHRPSDASPHDDLTRLRKRDLLTASLLVLDDVGQEGGEVWRFGEVLDTLLKTRCDAGQATIITTNYETATDACRICRVPLTTCDGEGVCRGAHGRKGARLDQQRDLTREGLLTRYGPRGARIGERLTEFAEWVRCPHEGFRSTERREAVLKRRRESSRGGEG